MGHESVNTGKQLAVFERSQPEAGMLKKVRQPDAT